MGRFKDRKDIPRPVPSPTPRSSKGRSRKGPGHKPCLRWPMEPQFLFTGEIEEAAQAETEANASSSPSQDSPAVDPERSWPKKFKKEREAKVRAKEEATKNPLPPPPPPRRPKIYSFNGCFNASHSVKLVNSYNLCRGIPGSPSPPKDSSKILPHDDNGPG